MAIYGLEVPFGLLEPQSILLVLLEVFLLFVLPLTGRRTSLHCYFSCSWYCSASFLISLHSSALWCVELCTGQCVPPSLLPDA
jgi:hypothetical protein